MKSLAYSLGVICGIMIVVLLFMVLLKKLNNNNEIKTKYDERQQMVRGKGYKYSFWTMVALIVLCIVFEACEIDLPMQHSVLYFLIILISIMVHTTYCVFNDGYFGINNKPKQYYLSFVLIGLSNVIIGILNSIDGRLISDGKLDTPAINLFCGLMFVMLGICIVIKNMISKEDVEDEDDEDDEDDVEGVSSGVRGKAKNMNK